MNQGVTHTGCESKKAPGYVPGAFLFASGRKTLALTQVVNRMVESVWAATGPDWYRDAACKSTNSDDFSPAVETAASLAVIKRDFCDLCPVRDRCLQFAIISGDRGYWGGTSTAERMAMRRKRTRAKCPITTCRAPEPVEVGDYQVCLRCGASWQADRETLMKA